MVAAELSLLLEFCRISYYELKAIVMFTYSNVGIPILF